MSALYELVLLVGVLMLAALPFVRLVHVGISHAEWRAWYRLYLFLVVGAYFAYFWQHRGQTIAMRAWHLRLSNHEGFAPSWSLSWMRYGLAVVGWLTGVSLLWVLVDRDGNFLHDRLLGLTITRVFPPTNPGSEPGPEN
jgi:RDD family.